MRTEPDYALTGYMPTHRFPMAGDKTQWDKFHDGVAHASF